MKRTAGLALTLLSGLLVAASAEQPFQADQSFGASMPETGAVLSLKQAIAALDTHADSHIKIQGQVTEVCQAKGCWMILVDGDTYARITFEDYGFFVPIETSMQRSLVYGVLSEQVLSGAEAAHFAQDAGAQSTLQVQGEVREYAIVARAVQLEKRS